MLTREDGSAQITSESVFNLSPCALGNREFSKAFGIKYNYLGGAMYKGIASSAMVIAMAKAGFLSFFGTGGLTLQKIEQSILLIKESLCCGESFGFNLLANYEKPAEEIKTVELFLRHGVSCLEAAAYISLTPGLVLYRSKGLSLDQNGAVCIKNRMIAKISRPEVAEVFLRPAPDKVLQDLLYQGLITNEEARLAAMIPVADALCVEADSGGHTDQGNPYVLFPSIKILADRIAHEKSYRNAVWIGSAGGIGTPVSAAAAFIMGADFVLTGSINQCTVEAATSEAVKDMLQEVNIQDTAYAPAGDMFELGAKVQVVKKGSLFSSRANKLYDLYIHHDSLADLDEKSSTLIQEKYFKRSFDEVWNETRNYYHSHIPEKVDLIENNPKQKMAHIFRWYFIHSTRLAMEGDYNKRVDFQIHCGPALGAFNQWTKGTELESWRNRKVADIALRILTEAANIISKSLENIMKHHQSI